MSVSANSNGELRSLNRVQPIDPAYVQSWAVTLVGDASGGIADVTLNMPQDHAFVPLWFRITDTAATLAGEITMNPQIDVQGVALTSDLVREQVTAINGLTRFDFVPERILWVPDPGGACTVRCRIPNPGVAQSNQSAGQVYLWPVNEVRSLSPRQLWYFLQH